MLAIDRINYLNIGLMIGACLAAYVFPFELFLFSYAVLGPLHYLTEISWLHERSYFTESQKGSSGVRGPRRGSLAEVPDPNVKRSRNVRVTTKIEQAKRPNRAWLILVVVTMSVLIVGFVAAEILHAPINPKWEITMFYLVLAATVSASFCVADFTVQLRPNIARAWTVKAILWRRCQ